MQQRPRSLILVS